MNEMTERFGRDGVQKLNRLDALNLSLLWRLYLVTGIVSHMDKFDSELAKTFYNAQTTQINLMVKDLDKVTQEFQSKHGEI